LEYSEIVIKVGLDENKIPADIKWKASHSEVSQLTDCKAFSLNIWDPVSANSLNLTLWTDNMQTHEMHSFFFQSMLQQVENYSKATGNPYAKEDMMAFIKELSKKTSDWEESKK
jgi:gliding motility-associated protein GldC